MNITTQDGRSFSGTAIQILKQMQSLSFAQRRESFRFYMLWLIGNCERMNDVKLAVPLAFDAQSSDEQAAEQLVAELVRTGLATTGEAGA